MSDVNTLLRIRTMIALFCVSAATTTTILVTFVAPAAA